MPFETVNGCQRKVLKNRPATRKPNTVVPKGNFISQMPDKAPVHMRSHISTTIKRLRNKNRSIVMELRMQPSLSMLRRASPQPQATACFLSSSPRTEGCPGLQVPGYLNLESPLGTWMWTAKRIIYLSSLSGFITGPEPIYVLSFSLPLMFPSFLPPSLPSLLLSFFLSYRYCLTCNFRSCHNFISCLI